LIASHHIKTISLAQLFHYQEIWKKDTHRKTVPTTCKQGICGSLPSIIIQSDINEECSETSGQGMQVLQVSEYEGRGQGWLQTVTKTNADSTCIGSIILWHEACKQEQAKSEMHNQEIHCLAMARLTHSRSSQYSYNNSGTVWGSVACLEVTQGGPMGPDLLLAVSHQPVGTGAAEHRSSRENPQCQKPPPSNECMKTQQTERLGMCCSYL
jgi:hypothetical protein